MVSKTLSEIRPGKDLWKIKARATRLWDAILLGNGEQLSLDMILIDLIAFFLFSVYKLLMMMNNQGTMMHGVINKAYIEKFKPLVEEGSVYITANVRVTPAAQKYRQVENDKVLNFLPITTPKKVKDTEDIPKYSFKFFSTYMLSKRVDMDMYLSEIHIEKHLKGTLEDQMQYNRRTLEQLNLILFDTSNQDKIFTVQSTIDAINTRFGWYYISCNRGDCNKQLEKKFDHYYCSKCDKRAEPKARYKIKLEISDPTAAATCVLFDQEAQMVTNESADSMIDHDSKELPKPIQKICGQSLIFQFRLTEYNLTSFRPDYTVSRVFFPKEKSNSRIDMENIIKVTLLDYN
ncbi:hypothetical protein BAE44_0015257 [Dichanthelium oligosanthes]|uniref:Replication factor A C-terminal domain-containing protein n=1 Tax=Dichanthelium oligosanthes TaxID=888268 RepID=A0A1E5VFB0_9POAL|nr:hypothetical protein BAE44_0015257 [Dichanthelium oligosanthes]